MDFSNAPLGLAAWMACLFFLVAGWNQVEKFLDKRKAKPGQPPNEQIHQSYEQLVKDHKETRSRVIDLEKWRNALSEKMDSDKSEILKAGCEREERINAHIDALRIEVKSDIHIAHERVNQILLAVGRIEGKIQS